MAKLIVVEGPDAGCELEIAPAGQQQTFTAGRDPRAEVPLNDTAISRRHFSIERSPRGWRVYDLGSRNQTFVNGASVKEAALRDGDHIRAGDTELRFEDPGAPLEPADVASTILKELPALKARDTLLDRLDSIESVLEREEAGGRRRKNDGPREALARVRKVLEAYGELAATSSLKELFEKLLAEAGPALGADRAGVVTREGRRWVAVAAFGNAPIDEAAGVSDSVLEKALEGEKALLTSVAAAPPKGRGAHRASRGEASSVIAAPLGSRAQGGPGGWAIWAEREPEHAPFTEEDLQFLASLCDPVGPLLERIEAEEALRRENRNLFRSIAETKKIVGGSRAMAGILDFVRRAAPTPMTVLILGETGTGKELVASAIHYASPRRGRPFVAINCAALPENLVESELFGHERGAFTGAVTRRKGRFELADTGTVFLDEVGEMPLACQAKLLRLLEERQFERVGGTESVRVDVRVIAATNRDLLAAVRDGKFREDLYYRLSVLNVHIPPLRDRPEDVLLLAAHFLDVCGAKKRISKEAEKRLLAYAWPGNVRQVRNVIESAVVMGDGPEIRPDDLVLQQAAAGAPQGDSGWEPITLDELERRHVARVLEHTGGNKKRAAEILGIERCTLYAKLKSYEQSGS